jgi:hypothetical protein
MCSPELTHGVCQICTGPLTPQTAHVDRDGNMWDVHKGVCAIEAGHVPDAHSAMYWEYVNRAHNASTSEARRSSIKAFKKWVREIADENHYLT